MAWAVPNTASANTVWTSADYNTYVRNNFLVSEGAIAASEGAQLVAGQTVNSIVERLPNQNKVATLETTTSTSYVGLTTAMNVAANTGTGCLIFWGAMMVNNTANAECWMSWAVSGSTTVASSDTYAIKTDGFPANGGAGWSGVTYFNSLTPGVNTFTSQYRVSAGTGSFSNRNIVLIPY